MRSLSVFTIALFDVSMTILFTDLINVSVSDDIVVLLLEKILLSFDKILVIVSEEIVIALDIILLSLPCIVKI